MDLSLHFNDNPRVRIRTSVSLGGGSHEQLRIVSPNCICIRHLHNTNWLCDSAFG